MTSTTQEVTAEQIALALGWYRQVYTSSDATVLPQEMARYGAANAEDCALVPVYSRCWCIWHSMRSTASLTERMQHGDNPEQSREFALISPRLGDLSVECSNGHVREIEEWAAEVIRYAHPEEGQSL